MKFCAYFQQHSNNSIDIVIISLQTVLKSKYFFFGTNNVECIILCLLQCLLWMTFIRINTNKTYIHNSFSIHCKHVMGKNYALMVDGIIQLSLLKVELTASNIWLHSSLLNLVLTVYNVLDFYNNWTPFVNKCWMFS